MSSEAYSKKAINHFRNPKFAGEIKNADAVGQVGNLKCGDVMKIFLKIKNERIEDIKFQTYGCIGAIASSDVMCKLAKGKTIEQALKITHQEIVDELGGMPALKIHCSVLGTQALRKAIENFKVNKEKAKKEKIEESSESCPERIDEEVG